MDEDSVYCMAFSNCFGIGPARFGLLYKTYGSARRSYLAPDRELASLIGEKTAARFISFRKEFRIKESLDRMNEKGIMWVTVRDEKYPSPLALLPDAPICIYVKGDIGLFDFRRDILVGIVGTRKPSAYGQYVSRKFATGLSRCGVHIVSGMAMGIDAIAHRGALDEGSLTVAVLGCGVDVVYPPSNHRIYADIVEGGGIVISEFPPGTHARREYFVWRNRLISGLSRGVLVVEGTGSSGSLATARYAALQGKDVFAPPVPITSDLHEAPSILLKQGAKFVTKTEDILNEYSMTAAPARRCDISLTGAEESVVELLRRGAMTPDELALGMKTASQETSCLLSTLEIKGVIERGEDGKCRLVSGS